MKVLFVVTLVIITFSFAKCLSKVQQVKEMEPRTNLESRESDFDLIEVLTECNDSFRIEMSYIEALNASGSFPDETEKTPKCYIRCVLEKTGVTLEGEEFDPERSAIVLAQVRKTTPVEAIMDIANDCAKRSETCKCERSYQYLKCLMETEIQKYETKS
ncbi:general odorant-binding protein 84a [Pieris brassicae]|nr:general odorant-binding protein 84a [Pieris brassicae]